ASLVPASIPARAANAVANRRTSGRSARRNVSLASEYSAESRCSSWPAGRPCDCPFAMVSAILEGSQPRRLAADAGHDRDREVTELDVRVLGDAAQHRERLVLRAVLGG